MKKILFVSDLVGLGGGETSLINLVKELRRKGYNITVLIPQNGPILEKLIENSIEVEIRKELFLEGKKLFLLPFLFTRIYKFLRKNRYDIIHSNSLKPCFTFGICSNIIKKKFFYTCHGQWFKFSKLKKKILSYICKRIVTVSKNVHLNLINQGFEKKLLKQIYLGVDIEEFNNDSEVNIKKELQIPPETTIVGMVARFQEIKGQDIFVRAVNDLVVNQSLPETVFLIVGGNTFNNKDDQIYKQKVLDYIKKNKLNEKILLLGERTDVPNILKTLDILVVPSRNESFGMVIVEALLSKCPVIASKSDGPLEIIKDNKNGLFFENGNVEDLSSKIEALISNIPKREKLKVIGYEEAINKYSISNIALEYENLYFSREI